MPSQVRLDGGDYRVAHPDVIDMAAHFPEPSARRTTQGRQIPALPRTGPVGRGRRQGVRLRTGRPGAPARPGRHPAPADRRTASCTSPAATWTKRATRSGCAAPAAKGNRQPIASWPCRLPENFPAYLPQPPTETGWQPDGSGPSPRSLGGRRCSGWGCTCSEQQKRPPVGRARHGAPGRTRTCGQALRRCGHTPAARPIGSAPLPRQAAGCRRRPHSLPSALPSLPSASWYVTTALGVRSSFCGLGVCMTCVVRRFAGGTPLSEVVDVNDGCQALVR
ncbi:hypothetical protein STSP_70340 [Streptomyces jeddahensis]|uniref:Uncharacterized protein n=1 Tax=Streptomyces jeddahensis TaxID=1716141 RepID=A0A177HF09_9ACTN|nr:hypothetical protein STSP_70340 [Streptomyces jeddahensis]